MKPRAMSRGGRWRLAMSGARTAALVALLGGLVWGGWRVAGSLQKNPEKMPAAAKSVPMKAPELKTTRDGVLDNAWLARTLELPPRAALMELDLERLRSRVLRDQQVLTATVTRHFPDRLLVQVTERSPVARLRLELGGVQRDLLVARDGVVFEGTGFDPGMLATLPWLDGVGLVREGAGFRPIADMDVVSRLLADAQFSAGHLYRTWQSVSLARLELDREIEVTTKSGTTAVFSAKGEFFVQLARLDYLMERLARVPGSRARIDLTLGREVPVTMIEPLVAIDAKTGAAKPAASPLFSLFPGSQSKNKREL